MSGFTGKLLEIDLASGEINTRILEAEFYRKYLGGKGIVSKILLEEVDQATDPFGPENPLIFATGVLTGIPVAGMPRYAVGAKSPLTGGYGQSEAGGFWGPELKKAGYDGIVMRGISPKPVYLLIEEGKVELRDADHLWGKETGEVENALKRELGSDIKVLQIGPAGENLVRYACLINNLRHANGRGGLGAVTGSKRVKAIAVRGSGKVKLHDSEKVRKIGKDFLGYYLENPLTKGLYEYGTLGGLAGMNAGGILPTYNFRYGSFDGADSINAEKMNETILKRREGCYACAVRCKRRVEISRDDLQVSGEFGGPEYETVAAFGSIMKNDQLDAIAKAHELCNRWGLDTISAGMTIAFAMEAKERGLLDDINLDFGDMGGVLSMLHAIAYREGIGNELAEGSERFAEKMGIDADEFLMTVKGQELPMHDPRGKVGVGIGYALNETGADHMVIGHDPMFSKEGFTLDSLRPLGVEEPLSVMDLSKKKVQSFRRLQYWWSFFNMAGICDFVPAPRGSMPVNDLVELIRGVTGWDVTVEELLKAGERSVNMSRLVNLKIGFGSQDDVLPERLHHGIENGPLKGTPIDRQQFEEAIRLYYELAGWDEDGVPTEEKLNELGIVRP